MGATGTWVPTLQPCHALPPGDPRAAPRESVTHTQTGPPTHTDRVHTTQGQPGWPGRAERSRGQRQALGARVTAADLALLTMTQAHQGSQPSASQGAARSHTVVSGAARASARLASCPQETRSLCTAPELTLRGPADMSGLWCPASRNPGARSPWGQSPSLWDPVSPDLGLRAGASPTHPTGSPEPHTCSGVPGRTCPMPTTPQARSGSQDSSAGGPRTCEQGQAGSPRPADPVRAFLLWGGPRAQGICANREGRKLVPQAPGREAALAADPTTQWASTQPLSLLPEEPPSILPTPLALAGSQAAGWTGIPPAWPQRAQRTQSHEMDSPGETEALP